MEPTVTMHSGVAVGAWGTGGTPVLAIHGITASHRAWTEVAGLRSGLTLAPDLRGRGRSRGDGPFGMEAHARDCVDVLDAFGVGRAVVVGHSMGGFVASVLAFLHPERVERVVLVDGGAPLPPVTDIESALGPAVRRLSMRFASREDYREFWRAHPAFRTWTPAVESYVDYDLTGDEPELRSRVDEAAVRADFEDLHNGPLPRAAFAAIDPDTVFLRAERGLFDEPTPLYPTPPPLRVRTVPDTNHYSILFDERGARAVVDALS